MKCSCCDRILNSFESTRKSKSTGEYLDICNKCYSTIADDMDSVGRSDCDPNDTIDDDDDDFEPFDSLLGEDDEND